MRTFVPDYYLQFKCIADKCRHTCCKGWEVEIDDESLHRFQSIPDIEKHIEMGEDNHFRLLEGEVCPFLEENGLCKMILRYGENMLCQTCTDHPRFRNFWNDRIEMGLGLVCEEAARLVLGRRSPMKLVILTDNQEKSDVSELSDLPEDEKWLMDYRDSLLNNVREEGPIARFREYLIYRHIANALYDDRLEERVIFVNTMVDMVSSKWKKSDGSFESLVEIVRQFSYDIEYEEDRYDEVILSIGSDDLAGFME